MAYLSKFGTLWGVPPLSQGRVYWVAPSSPYYIDGRSYDASDNNDGTSPERALSTLARALVLAGLGQTLAGGGGAISNSGEVIILLPGTHTVTALVRAQTAGVTITGIPSSRLVGSAGAWGTSLVRPASILTSTGTSTPLLSIEANNIEVANLTLRPTAGFSAVIFRNQIATAPTGFRLHDCTFDLETPVPSISTYGLDFAYRADNATSAGNGYAAKGSGATSGVAYATAYVERCTWIANGAQGRGVDLATANVVFRDCLFHVASGVWATPFAVATDARGCVIQNSIWSVAANGTFGDCIDGTRADRADALQVLDCRFPRAAVITTGSPIDNVVVAGSITATECYAADNATAIATSA